MSYSTVLAIYPGDRFEDMEELRNSWLSAPLIWNAVAQIALGREAYPIMPGPEFWALHKDDKLKPYAQAVFRMTFDGAYVLKRDFARAAEDIATFQRSHNVGGHWVRIRDIFLSDPDVPAIGFYMTSVGENSFQGAWDEAAEDYAPMDWSEAWSVYEERPALVIEAGTAETP